MSKLSGEHKRFLKALKGYPRIEREEPPSLQGVTIDLYGPPRYARGTTDGRSQL